MSRIISIALGLAALHAAIASPVAEVHPALITPSPVLQKREFSSDFIGYALWYNGLGIQLLYKIMAVADSFITSRDLYVQRPPHVYL